MREHYQQSRLLSLSKGEINSILKSLNSKLSNPLFYSRFQLSGMRKRKADLEARLGDLLDEENFNKVQVSNVVGSDLEMAYHADQTRKGKSALKSRSGIYRIRPGPKSTLSIRAKINREKRLARLLP